MCGICGFYSFQEMVSSENLIRMNQKIRHRGPDDEGFFFGRKNIGNFYSGEDSQIAIKEEHPILPNNLLGHIGLGFRRLSIIDLSVKAHQPMALQNGKYIITFNGEIYNFKTIKQELITLGYSFESLSDTEVLLNAYVEWGTGMISKLDGMFAFAILDKEKNRLVFARDRVGMKPFFYSFSNDKIVWASEIKALLETEWITPKINWTGVYSNFVFMSSLSPETCFESIFSLEPGSFMTLDLETFEYGIEKFWSLPTNKTKSFENPENTINELLNQSILLQMNADVPVINMMSGGIDSTLITAKSNLLNSEIGAYTVDYHLSKKEIDTAKLFAKQKKIQHAIYEVQKDNLLITLKENIQHFEEPYASLEVLLNAAEFAKKSGYKVVLSGNGADELFGGYSHTLKLEKWRKIRPLSFISPLIPTNNRFLKKVKNYFSQNTVWDFFRAGQGGMKDFEIKELFQKENLPNQKKYNQTYKKSQTDDVYNDYFTYDMTYSLSSHHVYRDDISAMKHSVEFRYPYLSNDLIDFVAQLPTHLRYNGKINKPLLRKVAKNHIQKDVLEMPKQGFSFPLAEFIKTKKEVRDFVEEQLESLKKRNLFHTKTIDNWWQNINSDFDYAKIWQLVTFELWYQKYFDKK